MCSMISAVYLNSSAIQDSSCFEFTTIVIYVNSSAQSCVDFFMRHFALLNN